MMSKPKDVLALVETGNGDVADQEIWATPISMMPVVDGEPWRAADFYQSGEKLCKTTNDKFPCINLHFKPMQRGFCGM